VKTEKRVLASLEGIYSTSVVTLGGRQYLIGASENVGKATLLLRADGSGSSVICDAPGGVMNVVQMPGSDELLSITDFFPIFKSEGASVYRLTPASGRLDAWERKKALTIPFVHRIGIVRGASGRPFLLASTLCESKAYQDDWSKPGSVYVTPIPASPAQEWSLAPVFSGLTKNHGLFIQDERVAYVAAEEGIVRLDFSKYSDGGRPESDFISRVPSSDLFMADIDGDGVLEAAVIEPFHGDGLALYKLRDGGMENLYRDAICFGHAIWIGTLRGVPSMLVGNRGGKKELLLYRNRSKGLAASAWEKTVIDEGGGPTQVSVLFEGDRPCVLSANHETGEAVLYRLA